jgi:ADP-ribose pyrophosphatase
MDPKKNSWICQSEKTLLSSPFMKLVERKCQSSEDQREFTFFVLKSRDWCNIIPVTEDGNVVLVRQFRAGISEHTLEVPGGVTDSTDADSMKAAIREMEEETGYTLLPDAQCIELGWNYPNPAIFDNRCYSYVVGPVKKTQIQNLDPGEMIEVIEVPISELPERILRGEISHSLMLNTFFLLALRSESASAALKSELNKLTRIKISH